MSVYMNERKDQVKTDCRITKPYFFVIIGHLIILIITNPFLNFSVCKWIKHPRWPEMNFNFCVSKESSVTIYIVDIGDSKTVRTHLFDNIITFCIYPNIYITCLSIFRVRVEPRYTLAFNDTTWIT